MITIQPPDHHEAKVLARKLLTDLWHDMATCDYAEDTWSNCVFCRESRTQLDGDPNDEDQVTIMAYVIQETVRRLEKQVPVPVSEPWWEYARAVMERS